MSFAFQSCRRRGEFFNRPNKQIPLTACSSCCGGGCGCPTTNTLQALRIRERQFVASVIEPQKVGCNIAIVKGGPYSIQQIVNGVRPKRCGAPACCC